MQSPALRLLSNAFGPAAGDSQRDGATFPGSDLRLSRRFTIKENYKIEVLGEGFNIFNRTQVTGVNNRMYVVSTSGQSVNANFDPTFGTPSDLSNGFFFRERQIQFAVRFEF